MARAPIESSQLQIDALNSYVLDPPQRAHSLLVTEKDKLAVEIEQFEKFRQRVRAFEAVQSASPGRRTLQESPGNLVTADILDAYADTVLTLDHYEEYDESLWDNACAELGTEVATLLRADSTTQFTPVVKQVLLRSVSQSIKGRERLAEHVDTEIAAINTSLSELVAQVEAVNGSAVPEWYRQQHEQAIDDLIMDRQQHLHDSTAPFNRKQTCSYLFDSEPWTYPVLLAGTRLREVSVVEQ